MSRRDILLLCDETMLNARKRFALLLFYAYYIVTLVHNIFVSDPATRGFPHKHDAQTPNFV